MLYKVEIYDEYDFLLTFDIFIIILRYLSINLYLWNVLQTCSHADDGDP